ncbi:MAG: hypothetical protein WB037_18695 [Pseudolabrys sp.]
MDQWTRDMIAEACRLDDEAIAFCGDERDHVVEKNYDDLVFKTHTPQPAAVPRMDAASTADWNLWFKRGFENLLDPILEHISTTMNRCDDELFENDKKLKDKIIELQKEVAELRADLHIARALITGEVKALKGTVATTTKASHVA